MSLWLNQLTTDLNLNLIYKFFILFPFITFFTSYDSLPYIVPFMVIVALSNFKFTQEHFIISLLIFIAFLCLISSVSDSRILNFLHYVFFGITFLGLRKIKLEINPREILIAQIIYLIFAIIQVYDLSSLSSFFVPNIRGVHHFGRGVTSLTPEPSFYGTVMLCHLILLANLHTENLTKKIAICLTIFQIVFLSMSTLSILFLAVWLISRFQFKLKTILFAVFISLSVIYVFDTVDENNYRFTKLINSSKNIENILYDESVKKRFSRLIGSVYSPIYNFPTFGSFGNFNQVLNEINVISQDLVFIDDNDRISGGFTPLLHHFGIFSLVFIIYFFYKVSLSKKENKTLFFLIALSPIIIFNPLFVYILSTYFEE